MDLHFLSKWSEKALGGYMNESKEIDKKGNAQTAANGGRYLIFSLGTKPFAIPLLEVREVIAYKETTPIPHSPPYFKGIMNLRGLVISVIDLRMKLGQKEAAFGAEASVVILDIDRLQVGVIVDSVDSVLTFEAADISPAPGAENTGKKDHLSGVAKHERELILILDIKSALDVTDLEAIRSQQAKPAA